MSEAISFCELTLYYIFALITGIENTQKSSKQIIGIHTTSHQRREKGLSQLPRAIHLKREFCSYLNSSVAW